jgi:hypothetical protein
MVCPNRRIRCTDCFHFQRSEPCAFERSIISQVWTKVESTRRQTRFRASRRGRFSAPFDLSVRNRRNIPRMETNRLMKLEIPRNLHSVSEKVSTMKSEMFRIGRSNYSKRFGSDHPKHRNHVLPEERIPHRSSIPRQSWLPIVRTIVLPRSCFMNSPNNRAWIRRRVVCRMVG